MEAGDHVPANPLLDVFGKVPGVVFWQYPPNDVKIGAVGGLIVMFIVVDVAHCPAAGVNVYVCVPTNAVEIVGGDQLPVNPLLEVIGRLAGKTF